MKSHHLLGCSGCGSAIVEAAFAIAGIPLEYEEVDYEPGSPTRDRLLAVNPLGQVPALVLPGGEVMTESLAMLHYVNDLEPSANLVPPPGDATRRAFYHWAVFIVAALYPTWTYGDDPAKWAGGGEGAKKLKETTDEHRKRLWLQVEQAAKGPWFLGERFSAIDLYIAVMSRWRPGRKWFMESTPKLLAIAQETSAIPRVAEVIRRNFN
jgi:GST-like protein